MCRYTYMTYVYTRDSCTFYLSSTLSIYLRQARILQGILVCPCAWFYVCNICVNHVRFTINMFCYIHIYIYIYMISTCQLVKIHMLEIANMIVFPHLYIYIYVYIYIYSYLHTCMPSHPIPSHLIPSHPIPSIHAHIQIYTCTSFFVCICLLCVIYFYHWHAFFWCEIGKLLFLRCMISPNPKKSLYRDMYTCVVHTHIGT